MSPGVPVDAPNSDRRLHLHARPHGRGHRDAVDEGALGAGRLRLLHRIGEGLDVLHELLGRERRLADAGLHDAGLLHAELDRAALGALDRAGHVHGDGADLRIGHQAARARAPCRGGRPAASGRGSRCSGRIRWCRPAPSRPGPRRRPRPRRRPSPRRPWRRARTRRRATRAAGAVRQVRPRRAPSGRRGADRRRDSSPLRWSRRTWPWPDP